MRNRYISGLFNDALLQHQLNRLHIASSGSCRTSDQKTAKFDPRFKRMGMGHEPILPGDLRGVSIRHTGVPSGLALGIAGGRLCKVSAGVIFYLEAQPLRLSRAGRRVRVNAVTYLLEFQLLWLFACLTHVLRHLIMALRLLGEAWLRYHAETFEKTNLSHDGLMMSFFKTLEPRCRMSVITETTLDQ